METDESPSSSTFLIHPFTPSNLSLDEHPTPSVIVTVIQDAEFRGLAVVCQDESSFIQIQCNGFKGTNRVVLGDRVVPIQFSKPHLSYRRAAKVVLTYLPATYEISFKGEL